MITIIFFSPEIADSSYFNYKSSRSFVLLIICDIKYIFTLVNIGVYERRSEDLEIIFLVENSQTMK